MDENIDKDLEENLRFALVKKMLVYMLENAQDQVII